MKHTAKYLDSGFYTVSDKAAGSLVRSLGQKLPKLGWQKFVMLKLNGEGQVFNAWMQRADVRSKVAARVPGFPKRGWVWAIFAIRPNGEGMPVTLGKSFQFVSHSTLNAKAA